MNAPTLDPTFLADARLASAALLRIRNGLRDRQTVQTCDGCGQTRNAPVGYYRAELQVDALVRKTRRLIDWLERDDDEVLEYGP